VRVPRGIDNQVATAERALARAAERLATAEANAKATFTASQPKATTAKAVAKAKAAEAARPVTKAEATQLAAVAKATKQLAYAKAEAEEWHGVPEANGLATIARAEVTNRTKAATLAKVRAELAPRWDLSRAEVMKAAKGHAKADPTASAALAKVAKASTNREGRAANGTVSAEAKRAATAKRVAEYRERQRQAKGISAARRYNSTARNAGR
jgi:hypothetical protein